jgi:hypothetical protein
MTWGMTARRRRRRMWSGRMMTPSGNMIKRRQSQSGNMIKRRQSQTGKEMREATEARGIWSAC